MAETSLAHLITVKVNLRTTAYLDDGTALLLRGHWEDEGALATIIRTACDEDPLFEERVKVAVNAACERYVFQRAVEGSE